MTSRHEKYALQPKPLGIGGQAEVFQARDKRTGAIVALKRLTTITDETIARMRREIEVQKAVVHPNIMPIFDHSTSYRWYNMPLAAQVLGQLPPPIDEEIVYRMVEDCAKGLATAHERGYIHRDLTPNNIFLLNDEGGERWAVSDWGLVRRHGQTTVVRTQPGQEFGTAGFAAPELWSDAHEADCRADVYSLGRVVAWCLTGKWPIPNIPLLPEGKWKAFVEATTGIEPNQRIQDMSGILNFIERMNPASQPISQLSATPKFENLPGLSYADTLIFKTICEISIEKGIDWFGPEEVQNRIGVYSGEDELFESIDMLADEALIRGDRTLDGKIHFFQITAQGFEEYARVFMPDFERLVERALVSIVTLNLAENKTLSERLGQPQIIIDYALDILANRRYISITKTLGGNVYVDEVTVRGRRAARKQ